MSLGQPSNGLDISRSAVTPFHAVFTSVCASARHAKVKGNTEHHRQRPKKFLMKTRPGLPITAPARLLLIIGAGRAQALSGSRLKSSAGHDLLTPDRRYEDFPATERSNIGSLASGVASPFNRVPSATSFCLRSVPAFDVTRLAGPVWPAFRTRERVKASDQLIRETQQG